MGSFQRELFRIAPKVGAEFFKTYSLARPFATHWRSALCAEVNCQNHARGWRIVLNVATELGQKQGRYIRDHSGRSYVIVGQEGNLITLEFAAGQKCFKEHRVPLERDPIATIRGGDYRGNPVGIPTRRLKVAEWVDDFGGHQNAIKEQRERG